MTTLTVNELHERAENKIGAQLLGRYRDLSQLEKDLENGHYKLSEELIQTQIDATLNDIDTMEYIREAIEVYSNLSTFNRE
jgi:hypothetical protein